MSAETETAAEISNEAFLAALRTTFLDENVPQYERELRLMRMMQYRWEPQLSEKRLASVSCIRKRHLNWNGTPTAEYLLTIPPPPPVQASRKRKIQRK